MSKVTMGKVAFLTKLRIYLEEIPHYKIMAIK